MHHRIPLNHLLNSQCYYLRKYQVHKTVLMNTPTKVNSWIAIIAQAGGVQPPYSHPHQTKPDAGPETETKPPCRSTCNPTHTSPPIRVSKPNRKWAQPTPAQSPSLQFETGSKPFATIGSQPNTQALAHKACRPGWGRSWWKFASKFHLSSLIKKIKT
jgi:hypothetical protein